MYNHKLLREDAEKDQITQVTTRLKEHQQAIRDRYGSAHPMPSDSRDKKTTLTIPPIPYPIRTSGLGEAEPERNVFEFFTFLQSHETSKTPLIVLDPTRLFAMYLYYDMNELHLSKVNHNTRPVEDEGIFPFHTDSVASQLYKCILPAFYKATGMGALNMEHIQNAITLSLQWNAIYIVDKALTPLCYNLISAAKDTPLPKDHLLKNLGLNASSYQDKILEQTLLSVAQCIRFGIAGYAYNLEKLKAKLNYDGLRTIIRKLPAGRVEDHHIEVFAHCYHFYLDLYSDEIQQQESAADLIDFNMRLFFQELNLAQTSWNNDTRPADFTPPPVAKKQTMYLSYSDNTRCIFFGEDAAKKPQRETLEPGQTIRDIFHYRLEETPQEGEMTAPRASSLLGNSMFTRKRSSTSSDRDGPATSTATSAPSTGLSATQRNADQ